MLTHCFDMSKVEDWPFKVARRHVRSATHLRMRRRFLAVFGRSLVRRLAIASSSAVVALTLLFEVWVVGQSLLPAPRRGPKYAECPDIVGLPYRGWYH